jgi:hypothetical protein
MTNPHPCERVSRRRALQVTFCSSAALERIWFSCSDDLANLETEARGRRTLEELWAASAHATSQSAVGAAEEIPLPPRSRRYTKSGCALTLNLRSVGAEAPVDRAVFEDVYPEGDFSCPCSAVLGNHDYSDNPGGELAQLRYAKQPGTRWHMPAKWYRTDDGGARTRALSRRDRPVPFARDVHGFTHVHLVGDELRISHHTVDGAVVHRFTKRSDGGVQMDAV